VNKTVCGVDLHYEIYGNGPRRVVLLHGWGCSGKLMRCIGTALEKDMTVMAVDFPAHGESGRPPEPWGVPDFAEAIKQLLKETDFLPCSVVAHSFGVRVTIWLAAHDATMFEKLVLTGAAGIRKPQTEEGRKRSEQFKKLNRMAEKAKKMKIFGNLPEKWQNDLRQKYGSADYNALDEEMRKTFVKVINQDLSELLPQIQQPTLLLWGDKDTETPLWMGRQMEREIPDAGLVVLEGGSHFAYAEQSARFNTIAHHFLTEG